MIKPNYALWLVRFRSRSRPQVYQAIDLLESAGVLISLSEGRRNQAWEAAGLLDLVAGLEAGEPPG